MNQFVEFNAVKFLQNSKTWKNRKLELEKELEAITEIKGSPDNPSRSGNISDPVSSIAMERERIEYKLYVLNKYQKVLDYALNRLSSRHRDVIEAFFLRRGYIHHNAQEIALKYGVNYPKGVYKLRREALEEFTRIVTNRYL